MKLTKMIFDYWKIWMSVLEETNIWANEVLDEGITYCDGYFANFWWILNEEWYKMNNKMYAYTGCVEPYALCLEPYEADDLNFMRNNLTPEEIEIINKTGNKIDKEFKND